MSVSLTADTIPVNCNKPDAPVAIAAGVPAWTDISAALVANARYELLYIPTDVTQEVLFYLRDDTAANLTGAGEVSGRVCRSGTAISITPLTATPLALLRHPATDYAGLVYLTRIDN